MTPSCPETIVALATAPGRSGVAIVRVSGALAFSLVERICKLKPKPRYNHFAKFYGKYEVLIDIHFHYPTVLLNEYRLKYYY